MSDFVHWSRADAAAHVAVPVESSDKYSRGVLGVITGSDQYPGAAVLGVEAALHTGVGMVRYLGGERVSTLVLQQRPEAVTAEGRVQAWLIGSGTDSATKEEHAEQRVETALAQALPTVLDGGALERVHDVTGPTIITPHFGELARLFDTSRADVAADPAAWATRAAEELGVTVMLKGHTTYIVGGGVALTAAEAPVWTATAGAGDALAGILGALVATHDQYAAESSLLARLAATACVLHGLAGKRAGGGGPFTVLALAAALPATIAELLR